MNLHKLSILSDLKYEIVIGELAKLGSSLCSESYINFTNYLFNGDKPYNSDAQKYQHPAPSTQQHDFLSYVSLKNDVSL
jgi:hypothetical protein